MTFYSIDSLLKIVLDANKRKASFIYRLNVVFRYCDLSGKSVNRRNREPEDRAGRFVGCLRLCT